MENSRQNIDATLRWGWQVVRLNEWAAISLLSSTWVVLPLMCLEGNGKHGHLEKCVVLGKTSTSPKSQHLKTRCFRSSAEGKEKLSRSGNCPQS